MIILSKLKLAWINKFKKKGKSRFPLSLEMSSKKKEEDLIRFSIG